MIELRGGRGRSSRPRPWPLTGDRLRVLAGQPDGTGALRAMATLRELRLAARRGCPDHPAGDCGCPVLTRPEPTDAYAPGAGSSPPRPHLPPSRLRGPGRLGRRRPRPPARRRRDHRLRQPVLPVPPPPPAQDPRPGVDLRDHPRRHPHRARPQRRHPHQPPTGPAADRTPGPHPTTRPTTRPAPTGSRPRRRPATLLTPPTRAPRRRTVGRFRAADGQRRIEGAR
jgi:hypothetical protein